MWMEQVETSIFSQTMVVYSTKMLAREFSLLVQAGEYHNREENLKTIHQSIS
jgi:hypothetical protein